MRDDEDTKGELHQRLEVSKYVIFLEARQATNLSVISSNNQYIDRPIRLLR